MVVESHYRKVDRPIMLVPVFISYDKLMEGKNYLKELGGKKKRKESLGQLIKAGKVLRTQFGNAYLNFGEPLELSSYLAPAPLDASFSNQTEIPWRSQLKHIAREVMVKINHAALINPSAIFSLILLATPKKALSIDHLIAIEGIFIRLAEAAANPRHPEAPAEGPPPSLKTYEKFSEALADLEKYLDLERFSHPSGDILYVQGNNSHSLSYYRNNIVHFFVLPSILANLLRHNNGLSKTQIIAGSTILYGFFNQHYFLENDPEDFGSTVASLLEVFTSSKLVVFDAEAELYLPPNILSDEFSYFKILCNIHGAELERIGIYALTIIRYGANSRIMLSALTAEYSLITTRLALLTETQDLVGLPDNYVQQFLHTLAGFNFVSLAQEHVIISPTLIAARSYFSALLSWEIASSFKSLPTPSEKAEKL
jgi:glycerol-3-phosphate O-acyltransferase